MKRFLTTIVLSAAMSASAFVVGCGLFSPRVCLSDYAMLPFRVEFYQEEPLALARQAKEMIPSLSFTGDEIPEDQQDLFQEYASLVANYAKEIFSPNIERIFESLYYTWGLEDSQKGGHIEQ